MKILCVGHMTFDTTVPVKEFPDENEKYHLNEKIDCGGGPASNAGYLLKLWGEDVSVAGVVGDDFQGHFVKEEFDNIGINTDYLEMVPNMKTDSSYIIANTSNGSRTILTFTGDRKSHPCSKVINDKYDCILLDGEDAQLGKKVIENNPDAIKILDAGNLRDGTVMLSYLVDYLVCSHDYAEDYTNMKMDYNDINSIIKIYEKMKESYNNKIIITLESYGCFTEIDGKYEIVPSIETKPLDSTGAGDIFHGAFTYFLIHGYDMRSILKYSNITGALSVEKIGSRNSMSKLEDVLKKGEVEIL